MSWKVSGACWDLDLPANKMLVLLALADHADHEGNNVYPSIGLVAWKTGYSENQVRRIMHALVKDGILIEVNRTPGKVVKYSIDTSKGKAKAGYTPKEKKHSQSDTPTNMIAHPPQNGSPTPTIAVVAEPSLEPINNQKTHSAPNGTHGKSPKAKAGKVREVDPYFEAIATVWHTRAGGFIGGIKSMMLGKATGKSQYAKGNFDEPVVDPQEILDFGVWAWKRVESRSAPNNGQKPELPTYGVTIQKWFYDFRDDRRAHAITPAAPTPEAPWTNSGDYFKWRAEQLESGL